MSREQAAALTAHPSTPAAAVRSLSAQVRAAGPGLLVLHYELEADLPRLRVPAPGRRQRTDGLWKHTCFEAFVLPAGGSAYREFNFSPSGDWAAYTFTQHRQGMADAELPEVPQIEARQETGRLLLDCRVAWPAPGAPVNLRVGLAAVIETDDGRISYWAARHAPDKPDFHHPESFILELTT
jgi:hypothetical protein